MLVRSDANTIQSSEGYLVQAVHIHDIRYQEGSYVLLVPGEILIGNPNYALYASQIKLWNPPHDKEIISLEKKKQIIERICGALQFLNIEFALE